MTDDKPEESFYGNAQRRFREGEWHGPVQMARKQKIWEDWKSWKAAKQQEMRTHNSRGRGDPTERAGREEGETFPR